MSRLRIVYYLVHVGAEISLANKALRYRGSKDSDLILVLRSHILAAYKKLHVIESGADPERLSPRGPTLTALKDLGDKMHCTVHPHFVDFVTLLTHFATR